MQNMDNSPAEEVKIEVTPFLVLFADKETKENKKKKIFQRLKEEGKKLIQKLFHRPPQHLPRSFPIDGEEVPHPLRNKRSSTFNPLTFFFPPTFPDNVVRNQKYQLLLFLPIVLYEQFKYFFNLYFLLVALSQFFPPLKVGFIFTYIAPLSFVLTITILKEAWDDFQRYKRDREANSQQYTRLTKKGEVSLPSSDIKVGYLLQLHTNQRVPADMVLLRTTEKSGASFIRTDQLDGETDWKLRKAVGATQKLAEDADLFKLQPLINVEKPKKDIYHFLGNVSFSNNSLQSTSFKSRTTTTTTSALLKDVDENQTIEPLNVENTLWANTVIASGSVIGVVIYTGRETRSVMNTNVPQTKVGLLDMEINNLSKFLFVLLLFLSGLLTALKGFSWLSFWYFARFMLLFSGIIPISMRVNLDMAKTLYSYMIMRDPKISGTVVRTSTIPEELGRIQYLLTDKTGTLTQNDMVFKKLHLGVISFSKDSLMEVSNQLELAFNSDSGSSERDTTKDREREKEKEKDRDGGITTISGGAGRMISTHLIGTRTNPRTSLPNKVRETITAIALCHNVTPVKEDMTISYQASSPDEVALVKFTESVGLTLTERSANHMVLSTPFGTREEFEVLNIFPFTSETKRMGIIVRKISSSARGEVLGEKERERREKGEIYFLMKGADVVMSKIVQQNDWLEEECGNMAREGLRTLVFGMKRLEEREYEKFSSELNIARASIEDRDSRVAEILHGIEKDLRLLALTGVEDKLQEEVKGTLEMLRNAGIKIWMLTGDKIETATCIAISSKLVSKTQSLYQLVASDAQSAYEKLREFESKVDCVLVIDGSSLQLSLDNFKMEFLNAACKSPAVVCCRCSPTQKAEIVRLIKETTNKRTCAIGDGGNDVSMIQTAHVGVGIVGKEGKQLLWPQTSPSINLVICRDSSCGTEETPTRDLLVCLSSSFTEDSSYHSSRRCSVQSFIMPPLPFIMDGCWWDMRHSTPWHLYSLWFWMKTCRRRRLLDILNSIMSFRKDERYL
eukprot:TRINITY_DN8417_c0_g1_i2.p1 TRINITY_DN8417_c0_g1~~TRINITY_DN8417_c0_g1_i2.p1  ORF type:complete len:1054 (-),score=266.66 TRINITY_DN8417_c0_g1_i2:518-3571(-)